MSRREMRDQRRPAQLYRISVVQHLVDWMLFAARFDRLERGLAQRHPLPGVCRPDAANHFTRFRLTRENGHRAAVRLREGIRLAVEPHPAHAPYSRVAAVAALREYGLNIPDEHSVGGSQTQGYDRGSNQRSHLFIDYRAD